MAGCDAQPELIALAEQSGGVLVREGDAVAYWQHDGNAWHRKPLGVKAGELPISTFALSPFGHWFSWVEDIAGKCDELMIGSTDMPGKSASASMVNPWADSHAHHVAFASFAGNAPARLDDEPLLLLSSWDAYVPVQRSPGTGCEDPNMRGGVWSYDAKDAHSAIAGAKRRYLCKEICAPGDATDLPPTQRIARANGLSFITAPVPMPWVAIFGADEPVQLLEWTSQTAHTLGTVPARKGDDAGMFTDDAVRFLSVHNDGTARLWEVVTGREVMRIAAATSILRAVLLTSDDDYGKSTVEAIVTLDETGALQAWKAAPTLREVSDVLGPPR